MGKRELKMAMISHRRVNMKNGMEQHAIQLKQCKIMYNNVIFGCFAFEHHNISRQKETQKHNAPAMAIQILNSKWAWSSYTQNELFDFVVENHRNFKYFLNRKSIRWITQQVLNYVRQIRFEWNGFTCFSFDSKLNFQNKHLFFFQLQLFVLCFQSMWIKKRAVNSFWINTILAEKFNQHTRTQAHR